MGVVYSSYINVGIIIWVGLCVCDVDLSLNVRDLVN